LRPVLCKDKGKRKANEEKPQRRQQQQDGGEPMLEFAVFALRDLKQGEEVVLGWEWDDGNAVHALPALIQSPHLFG
jgi:2-C-methyl-D-erythritol 4-phosphate cytidylyltransferase